ncbi:hypothetical protein ACJX0J_029620, partial [Zea mays]
TTIILIRNFFMNSSSLILLLIYNNLMVKKYDDNIILSFIYLAVVFSRDNEKTSSILISYGCIADLIYSLYNNIFLITINVKLCLMLGTILQAGKRTAGFCMDIEMTLRWHEGDAQEEAACQLFLFPAFSILTIQVLLFLLKESQHEDQGGLDNDSSKLHREMFH